VYIFEGLAFNKKKAKDYITENMDSVAKKLIEETWAAGGDTLVSALKKSRVCTPHGLDSFNWILNLPLENSQMIEDCRAELAKDESLETKPEVKLATDSRAPMIEFSF